MFLCETCHEEKDEKGKPVVVCRQGVPWREHFGFSVGPCEGCGKTKMCCDC